MFPIFKSEQLSKKKKCIIYKRTDGSEKKLSLKVHRSFLLFRLFNNNIPEDFSPLVSTKLSNHDIRIVYKCVLYSYLSYKDRSIIDFPSDIKIEFEKFDSDVGRIPFFIVTDPTINAIVVSLRGSSCMDDFITDSMGNGVPYNNGKFHEGIFSTASYVFMTCQTKILELNEIYNSIHENDFEQSYSNNDSYQTDISETEDDNNEEETEFEEEEDSEDEEVTNDLHPFHKSASNENLHALQGPNRNSIKFRRTTSNENLVELTSKMSSHIFLRPFSPSNSNNNSDDDLTGKSNRKSGGISDSDENKLNTIKRTRRRSSSLTKDSKNSNSNENLNESSQIQKDLSNLNDNSKSRSPPLTSETAKSRPISGSKPGKFLNENSENSESSTSKSNKKSKSKSNRKPLSKQRSSSLNSQSSPKTGTSMLSLSKQVLNENSENSENFNSNKKLKSKTNRKPISKQRSSSLTSEIRSFSNETINSDSNSKQKQNSTKKTFSKRRPSSVTDTDSPGTRHRPSTETVAPPEPIPSEKRKKARSKRRSSSLTNSNDQKDSQSCLTTNRKPLSKQRSSSVTAEDSAAGRKNGQNSDSDSLAVRKPLSRRRSSSVMNEISHKTSEVQRSIISRSKQVQTENRQLSSKSYSSANKKGKQLTKRRSSSLTNEADAFTAASSITSLSKPFSIESPENSESKKSGKKVKLGRKPLTKQRSSSLTSESSQSSRSKTNKNTTFSVENSENSESKKLGKKAKLGRKPLTKERSSSFTSESGQATRAKAKSNMPVDISENSESQSSSIARKPLGKQRSSSLTNLNSFLRHQKYHYDLGNNTNHPKHVNKRRVKIIFTGHSLGAGVAAVVAYLFREKFPDLNVEAICFAPPPTMTFNLWKTTGKYIKSFMIEGDIVPFLSVLNLMKMSDILFPREGSNKAFKNFIVSYLEKKSRLNFAKIENLYPPGQMYLIRFTNDEEDGFFSKKKKKKNKKDKKNKKSDKIQLCQILNPDYFSNLVKNIQENNHFVKNYMRLIIRLMEKFKRRSTHL